MPREDIRSREWKSSIRLNAKANVRMDRVLEFLGFKVLLQP